MMLVLEPLARLVMRELVPLAFERLDRSGA